MRELRLTLTSVERSESARVPSQSSSLALSHVSEDFLSWRCLLLSFAYSDDNAPSKTTGTGDVLSLRLRSAAVSEAQPYMGPLHPALQRIIRRGVKPLISLFRLSCYRYQIVRSVKRSLRPCHLYLVETNVGKSTE